jgi:hypothetical protein
MSNTHHAAVNGTILKAQCVDSDYFLVRVKNFEEKYHMEWQHFLGEYNAGRLDKRTRDYVEWAFLCRAFSLELIQLEAKGPPGEASVFPEKPETVSGFCFAHNNLCSILTLISIRWKHILARLVRRQFLTRSKVRTSSQAKKSGD